MGIALRTPALSRSTVRRLVQYLNGRASAGEISDEGGSNVHRSPKNTGVRAGSLRRNGTTTSAVNSSHNTLHGVGRVLQDRNTAACTVMRSSRYRPSTPKACTGRRARSGWTRRLGAAPRAPPEQFRLASWGSSPGPLAHQFEQTLQRETTRTGNWSPSGLDLRPDPGTRTEQAQARGRGTKAELPVLIPAFCRFGDYQQDGRIFFQIAVMTALLFLTGLPALERANFPTDAMGLRIGVALPFWLVPILSGSRSRHCPAVSSASPAVPGFTSAAPLDRYSLLLLHQTGSDRLSLPLIELRSAPLSAGGFVVVLRAR